MVSLGFAIALGPKCPWLRVGLIHLAGITVFPLLAIILLFMKPRRWMPFLFAVGYLVTTMFLYPALVERYLLGHPGDPGMRWTMDSSPYYYVEDSPLGDPQYSGQVNLFPPHFDIPPNRQSESHHQRLASPMPANLSPGTR